MTLKTILAYIDPGTGALLWQMVIAAAVGCLFYVKKCRDFVWHKLSKLLGMAAKPAPASAKAEPSEKAMPGGQC